ncbi:MAG: DUF4349 domain-containing protein [Acidimicrobiia bacterium]|nr:DUF4349 domain-containing protein [bacterium]MDE0643116.1 DUF4349 domain-containing protein [bacterium]MXX63749.1 DUF4349 domain-containing protein [Acidimicrobiia bacterium]MYD03445.1 DUF4349 domain-containing protein [Acidimicrobiia bacterium]MYH54878.1 DUF4349 domain-containing protein [Acidimicrobiia bacterium]
MSGSALPTPIETRQAVRTSMQASFFALVAAFFLVAACGGTDDDSEGTFVATTFAASEREESADAEFAVSTEAMAADMAQAGTDDFLSPEDEQSSDITQGVGLANIDRDIIYRGSITVESPDVEAATREAVGIVQGLGGIIFGQQIQNQPFSSSFLTFKVLPEDFVAAMDRLGQVGSPIDRWVSADDVTERIVDLNSRISTAEASVLRLRELISTATFIEDISELESALYQRETDLEVLRGSLRSLSDQVSLSTIEMTIQQLQEPTGLNVQAWVADSDEDPCLGEQFLELEDNSEVFFCIQVENTGELPIVDLAISSDSLRIRTAESGDPLRFQLLNGTLNRIEPGGLVSAVRVESVSDRRMAGRVITGYSEVDFSVTGTPLTEGGGSLDEVTGYAAVGVDIEEESARAPGFGTALEVGFNALITFLSFFLYLAGWLIAFLPVFLVIGALYWGFRRWKAARSSRDGSASEHHEPVSIGDGQPDDQD